MRGFARPLAVTLLSAGALAYEILLVRIFAIEHFYHFAYMAIGVAMLGYGASGTLLALVRGRRHETAVRWFAWAAVIAPVSLVASAALVHQIPLDATQLLWDARQWPRLAGVYLLLALPFGVVALSILLALTLEFERPGWIYGASFLGSGVGALLAVALLWVLFPAQALAVPALLASLGAVSASRGANRVALRSGFAWATVLLTTLVLARPLWQLDITPFKGLPQVEAYPDARRLEERTSPLGWVVAADAAAFRHAPGLSLAYRGRFPRQIALFVDGQIAGAVSAWEEDGAAMAILDWLPSALPYALGDRRRVLVIGAGGGTEVWNAVAHGARRVQAVELHPDLAGLSATLTPQPARRAGDADIQWAITDARSYVSRSREEFDLVALAPGGALGASAAGVHSLNEDFLHTVEAYVGYLQRLGEDGVLAITRWLTVPPRESVRVILTAAEALRRLAPDAVADGLVVARSWATATVLVKPSGFTASEIASLTAWTGTRRFDLDWYPGMSAPTAQFNVLDEPTLFRAATASVAGSEAAAHFGATYPFDVLPADDARPYPHHFLRTGSVGAFLKSSRATWLPFAEWGYIALVATLVQGVLLAGLLTIVPAALRAGALGIRSWLRLMGYFAAIGVAYLAAEIAAIQQLNLLLGHPVYAVAVVLAAFLICSGAGSAWSDRLAASRGWIAGAGLAAALALYAVALLGLVHLLQPTHLIFRAVVAALALAPVAFLMGMPFPTGLRFFAGDDTGRVAWAWAANGFASVVATPLSALIALEAGSRTLFLAASAAYAGAAILQRSAPQRGGPIE